jgi:DNA-binding response OmpR family regulator
MPNPLTSPILIAEDDPISRRILETMLRKWGLEYVAARDGTLAWEMIQRIKPKMVLLDWMMPGLDGPTLCRMIRDEKDRGYTYIILLTIKDRVEDRIAGLESGADDYVTKPYDTQELHSRINVGRRIVELEWELAQRITELQESLSQVKQLQGLLPICSYCKKIRDDSNYWQQVEGYISDHTEARFSHGICPDCYEKYVKPQLRESGIKS